MFYILVICINTKVNETGDGKSILQRSIRFSIKAMFGLDFEEVDYCSNKLNNGKGSTWMTSQVNLERFLKKFKGKSIPIGVKRFRIQCFNCLSYSSVLSK